MSSNQDIINKVTKYLEYKEKCSEVEKKLEKYKNDIKKYLKSNKLDKESLPIATISLQKASKSSISKKNTPDDVWKKYSKSTSYEILNVRKNKN